jgi:hypothetical protein
VKIGTKAGVLDVGAALAAHSDTPSLGKRGDTGEGLNEKAQTHLTGALNAAPAASRFPTGIDRPNDVGSSFLAGSAAWNASISA